MAEHPRIVVVGAGFGGLQAAQSLAGAAADVLLIDRNSYHTFVPLLYQVATAQLAPEQIMYPVRTILRRSPNLQFLRATVRRVDLVAQFVETESAVIPYDYLVLATGSETRFAGVPGAKEYGFALGSVDEAVALRNHILMQLEQAAHEVDRARRQALLSIAIVGGGPTGVELAGACVEMIHSRMQQDYPTLDLRELRLWLVQAGDRLLADLPQPLGVYTAKRLRQLGVNVLLQTRVHRVTPTGLNLDSGAIAAGTVIWTAGLEATAPYPSQTVDTARQGKWVVGPTLQVQGYPNVYAIGDMAYVEQQGQPLVGVAPEALQQGVAVARNLRSQLRGQAPKPFRYFNKGRLAIIGCRSGVGKIGAITLTGWLAWLLWLGVHFVYLPGYRNRLLVLVNWLYSYVFRDRPIRLIQTPRVKPDRVQESVQSLS